MKYVSVSVDLTAESLDKPFTYRLPEGMTLSEGQRVLVPFGPRTVEGVAIGFSDECDLDPKKIRDVIRPLEGESAILPELIDIAYRMRDEYHCTFADALRQMLPAQMRGGRVKEKTVQMARLADETLVDTKASHEVAELLRGGPVSVAELEKRRPGARSILNRLRDRGAVVIEDEETYRHPYSAISFRQEADKALKPQQEAALTALTDALHADGGRFLLHGVTGSGKTEVYIRLIREALRMGRSAIVLVPEISLTPQMTDWFRARFGPVAAVMHSRLSAGERYDEWRRVRRGEARVVIGARSAIFAPVSDLGVVVIDEEHETSYVSDRHPCYDARQIGAWRAANHRAVLVLGSATPSISTYMKTMPGVRPENRIVRLEMPERASGRPVPALEIVDMRQEMVRGNRSIFSALLSRALTECLDAGKQSILFINRRGHSTFVSCRMCGYVEKCPNCDVSLTYHQYENSLVCHYCGHTRAIPTTCPECGSPYIKYFGAGTQKVQEECQKLLPGARILRVDADTTVQKDAHEKLLGAFRRREYDVMVGTQMIAKGLDFPDVTLVGVVAADTSLHVPDYRSVERTFQLLTQVAGRAGRADSPGRVVVQTYDPDHYGIQMAARGDYRAFYMQESSVRRRGLYPPFTVLARLLVTDTDGGEAMRLAQKLEADMNAYLDDKKERRDNTVQMRALEAPIKRMYGLNRWEVFIKLYARDAAWEILSHMQELETACQGEHAKVTLEINPSSMI